MKLNVPIIDISKFPRELQGPLAPIVQTLKGITSILGGQASLEDNRNAAVIQVDCVHASEVPIAKEILRGQPAFFQPLYTTVSRTDPTPALPVACTPQPLNYSRTDGYVGLTLRFNNEGAPTGYAGEVLSSFVGGGSAVPLTSNQIAEVTSIPVTPGDWLLSALGSFNNVPTGGTVSQVGIATTAGATGIGTLGTSSAHIPLTCNANAALSLAVPDFPVTVAATTTYRLKTLAVFGGGSCGGFGRITAVRTEPHLFGYTASVTGILWGG